MRNSLVLSLGVPVFLTAAAAACSAYALGSRGVIVAALAASLPMVLVLAGLRFDSARLRAALGGRTPAAFAAARWGPILLVHSHHEPRLAARGKELRAGARLFCAGCYGIAAGTLVGDAAALAYLAAGLDREAAGSLAALLPLAFAPIVVRYTVARRMSAGLRLLANALLAAGCWLVLLLADAWLASAAVNVALIAGFGLIALARHKAARTENRVPYSGRVVVRP